MQRFKDPKVLKMLMAKRPDLYGGITCASGIREEITPSGTYYTMGLNGGAARDYVKPYTSKEKHFFKANFIGPGTNIVKRVKENVKPMTKVDSAARQHDLDYYQFSKKASRIDDKQLAELMPELKKDIRKSDNRLISAATEASKFPSGLKAPLNFAHGVATKIGMKAKTIAEDLGVLDKLKFVDAKKDPMKQLRKEMIGDTKLTTNLQETKEPLEPEETKEPEEPLEGGASHGMCKHGKRTARCNICNKVGHFIDVKRSAMNRAIKSVIEGKAITPRTISKFTELTGASPKKFIKHLGKVDWKQYGKTWSIDHKKPLFDPKKPTVVTAQKRFFYTNARPMEIPENTSKSNKNE